MTCNAVHHGTAYANQRYGCTCPQALAARQVRRPAKVRGFGGDGRSDSQTVAARAGDVRRLTRAGKSARAIAVELRLSDRTVTRYRARERATA